MCESNYIWKQDKIGTLIKISIIPCIYIILGIIAIVMGNAVYIDYRLDKPQSIIVPPAIFMWLIGLFMICYPVYVIYGILTEKKGDYLRRYKSD